MPENKLPDAPANADANKKVSTEEIESALERMRSATADGLEGASLVGVDKDGLPPAAEAAGLGFDEETKPGGDAEPDAPMSSVRVFCAQHGMNPKALLPYVPVVTDIDEAVALELLEKAHAESKERI